VINLDLLMQKPPSKRWAAVYVIATAGGFLLSSYAAEIANKLAPGPKILVAGGSMTSDGDESGDVRLLNQSDAPADLDDDGTHPYNTIRSLDIEVRGIAAEPDAETIFDRIRRDVDADR
jgi:hypothetical protein